MKIIAALTAALLAQPIAAHAGRSCGGGGGDGGSSDHSSSSDSSNDDRSSYSSNDDSSSSSSDASTTTSSACSDDTDVVGYRQCTKFGGGWGMNPRIPRLFVELGTTVRQFGADAGGRTGNVWHGAENFTYRMVTPVGSDTTAAAVASTLRLGVGLGRGVYTGIEGELGALTSSPVRAEMMSSGAFGSPEVESRTAMLMGAAGFLGARVSSGRASLAIEGAGGVRDIRYRSTSTYHNCVDVVVVDIVQPVLEARARAELWLNPWFAVGAQAGANVAARGDWMTGLYLGIHSRAFGGR